MKLFLLSKICFYRVSGCTQKYNLQGRKFCAAYNAHSQKRDEESGAEKNQLDLGESSSSSTSNDGEETEAFSDISDDSDIFISV